jgi:hypothetical protein
MSNMSKTYALASLACLAITLAAACNAVAQEQSDQQPEQNQSTQSDQSQSDQQTQQNQQQQEERERQDQERQRQQQEREEQERQRQQQARQREQQSQDRDQSSSREWPQPDGRQYGSDSLRFPGSQQFGRDSQRSDRSQQGGLGVALRSDGREGVVVSQVHAGSPAEEMGIRPGDRITAVNGRDVQSVQQFIASIRNMDPGQQIELDIRRARGGEQTVRGELESRQEALAESGRQYRSDIEPGQQRSWEYGQDRDNRQTRYEEGRGDSQDRSGQVSRNRLEQIERQVDQLSRQLDDLRVALQSIRRQSGQPTEWNRERTARYEEYQGTSGQRRSDERWDGRETNRPVEREREFEREGGASRRGFDRDSNRGESRDRYDEGPGGEIGSDGQSVGSENIQDRN